MRRQPVNSRIYQQYLAYLIGTRADWPDNMTESEGKIMTKHFCYLKDLVAKKKVILAGPCFELRKGIVILQTESRQEARTIMDNDPSVKQGLHRYEIYPMKVSLLIDNLPSE